MATVSWAGAVNGNWGTGTLWNTGTVPSAGDVVDISVVGPYTVTITSQINAINSLTIGDTSADLELIDPGVTQSIAGTLSNSGNVLVDTGGTGGSVMSLGGNLINSGTLDIGNSGLTSSSTVTAAGLANTGVINLTGGSTATAVLDITAAALTNWTGTANLFGPSLLEFASGEIATIANTGSLIVGNASAFVADAGSLSSDSALTSLSDVAGLFGLEYGASLALAGGLVVGGTLAIDDNNSSTGSSLSVAGNLTNSGVLKMGAVDVSGGQIGGDSLAVSGTLANTGTIDLYDNSASAMVATVGSLIATGGQINLEGDRFGGGTGAAELIVNGGASLSGNISIGALSVLDVTGEFVETGGTTAVEGTLSAAGVDISGGRLVFDSTLATPFPITLGGSAIVEFGTAVAPGEVVTFGTGGELVLDDIGAFSGSVAQFRNGETIDLKGIGLAASYTYSGGVIDVKNAGGTVIAALSLTTPIAHPHFLLGTDGSSGTLLRIQNPNTFSSSYPSGIVLNTPSTQNPATITSSAFVGTGTLSSDPAFGVLGTAGFAWTVTNYGHIEGSTDGVYLTAGGTLVNGASGASSAFIEGGVDGIVIAGTAGTVVNFGTIEATASITDFGVYLKEGGSIANSGLIEGVNLGIQVAGAAATVSNSGTIEATGGGIAQGVDLEAGGNIANSGATALIEGGYGIRIVTTGTVDNFGTIAGRSASGVILETGGSVRNEIGGLIEATAGGRDGVFAYTAAGTVTNYGTIDGYRVGAHLQTGGFVTNAASAIIEGGLGGVGFGSAAGSVVNSGTIEGTGTSSAGIYFRTGGTFTNKAGGFVQGGTQGVYGHGVLAILNDGTIEATGSAGSGVLTGSGSLGNAALIEGATGVDVTGSYEAVTNSGTIKGTSGFGIVFYGGASLSNAAGALIYGTSNGVYIESHGGTIGVVDNLGTIEAANHHAVDLLGGGSVTNGTSGAVTALIEGAQFGVAISGGSAASLINFATIETTGTLGVGVELFTTGGILINGPSGATAALISGYAKGAALYGNSSTLVNYATIEGTGTAADGVYLYGGQLTNAAGALIEGGAIGIAVRGRYAAVLNQATILGTSGYGIRFNDRGVVTNTASAVISGATAGIEMGGGATLGSVVNLGTIEGTAARGAGLKLFAYGTGSGFVGNDTAAALIEGGRFGVFIYATPGATASIGNIGTIEATQNIGVGVYARYEALTIVNGTSGSAAGIIEGGSIAVEAGFGSTATITNFGTIAGTGTSGVGVDLGAGGTIIDGGTISGATAVYMGGAGNNLLVIDPGYTLLGRVELIGTGDVFELASAAAVGTLGRGGILYGVATLKVDTGADWLMPGTHTLLAGATLDNLGTLQDGGTLVAGGSLVNNGILDIESGARLDLYVGGSGSGTIAFNGSGDVLQIGSSGAAAGFTGAITNFTAGDTIDMGGIAANGTIYAGGVLTLTDNGTVVADLTLSTNVATPTFSLTSDGNGGTDVTLQQPTGNLFSGFFANGIVLDDAATQNPATITTSGTITNNSGSVAVLGTGGYAWTITNYGTIEGAAFGVDLTAGGALTNSADPGYIEGIDNGVEITGNAGTVANGGTIVGENGAGIYFGAGGTIDNSGLVRGAINGVFVTGGAGSVTNSGTIAATEHGNGSNSIILINGGYIDNLGVISNAGHGNGDFAIQIGLDAAGTIVNGSSGATTALIEAYHIAIITGTAGGPSTLTNFGTVETTGTYTAVNFRDGGAITNTASGLITGVFGGIFGQNIASTVVNSGTIEGTGTRGAGVNLAAGGAVTNEAGGVITGYGNGVLFTGRAGTLVNLGTIENSDTLTTGVYLGAGGMVTNGRSGSGEGLIVGARSGVVVNGTTGFVTNYGTIESLSTIVTSGSLEGVGVLLAKGGVFVNGTGGLIESREIGVYIGGIGGNPTLGSAGTVVNRGTIESSSAGTITATTVILVEGGTVANYGLIESAGRSGIYITGSAGAVTNLGTIVSNAPSSHSGVELAKGGIVVNGTSGSGAGLIVANWIGVQIINGGTVDNYGTIDSLGTQTGTAGNSGLAVFMPNGGDVVNQGLIEAAAFTAVFMGGSSGVAVSGGIGTVTNYGTVESAQSDAIGLVEGGVIVNGAAGDTSALIEGGTSSVAIYIGGIRGTLVAGATGAVTNYGTIENMTTLHSAVVLEAGGSVTNAASGIILGGLNGVSTVGTGGSGGAGTVVNNGSIGGLTASGVYLGDGGEITNNGTISGATNGILLTGGHDASVLDCGLVEAGVGILVSAADTAANRIVVGGTVVGTSGTAVYFAGGSDTLAIDDKAVFVGSVIGHGGTLELMKGSITATVSLGGTITGFDRVKVDAGAVWQLSDTESGRLALTNDGTLDLTGQLLVGNVVQNRKSKGTINLAAGAVAEFRGSVSARQKFVFTADSGILRLDDASAFKATIANFRAGDLIDVAEPGANGFSFAASFADHTLTITYFGVTVASLKLSGKFQTSDFTMTGDGRGGVYVSLGTPSAPALARASHFLAGGPSGAGGSTSVGGAAAFEPFGEAAQSLVAASVPAADNSVVNSFANPFHFWTLQN